jgi:hypothetical protein
MEIIKKIGSLRSLLILTAVGIWMIVLQNAGVIPASQNVKVVNTVQTNSEISGSVSVENTVDVNIHEINGYNTVTTSSGTHSVFPWGYMLPVDNW